MPVKKFGIYLGYPPSVDLRAEGLGRHLAEFLKGAQGRDDVRFVVACPSWLRANILQLCEACNVRTEGLEIISPKSKPLLLQVYQGYLAFKYRPRKAGRREGRLARMRRQLGEMLTRLEGRLVSTRSVPLALLLGSLLGTVFLVFRLCRIPGTVAPFFQRIGKRIQTRLAAPPPEPPAPSPLTAVEPVDTDRESLIARMYRLMEESEAALMRSMIEARDDIAAWYSPTAFWPHFNRIRAPRLMCVPDVVLTDFPTGFALVAGSQLLDNFRHVEKAIIGGEYFVTYSEETKWHTLVERYGADPDTVFVVPHGANRLDDIISVSGFEDNEDATDTYCRSLLRNALRKSVNDAYSSVVISTEIRFIFYASQFRPNKNVLSLLKAYNYLVKRRFIGHKLVLTGRPLEQSHIKQYIFKNNLQNDVLCLHGLTEQELAACYRLADLAVNPSLSEGGCPFTFTEALSVGTPVVMSRIPVTEEVITDPGLQDLTLFDPYDWKDMAGKIEWALARRELLVARQMPFYNKLAQRTWRNVVDEYVAVLEHISGGAPTDHEHVQGLADPGVRRTCA
ncbi:glycosyltransferase [Noviherbaspirillum sp. ST9]|uniref:glycosyltransferase n=1 Tax=Noviherbaspirillum sp. ST9 TaxID=3401606 RepID=UPI003B58A641